MTGRIQAQRPGGSPSVLRDRLCRSFTPVEVAVAVSVAPPDYLAAVVAGLDVAKLRDEAVALRGFVGDRFHLPHRLGGPTATERHRFPPHGDRDRWTADGPPGHVNYPGRPADFPISGSSFLLCRSQEVDR